MAGLERGALGDWVRSGEDEVCRVLRLSGGMDQKFAIVAKFLEPSGDVRGLIGDHRIGDSGFGAKVGGAHFGCWRSGASLLEDGTIPRMNGSDARGNVS